MTASTSYNTKMTSITICEPMLVTIGNAIFSNYASSADMFVRSRVGCDE